MPYFSSFVAKSWLNDLEDKGEDQRSLHMTHPLMLVIICAKYRKNPSRTVHAVEQTQQDVQHFSSFIAKSWLNAHEEISQGQKSLHITHSLILVITCAKYGQNPSRTVCAIEQTQQDVPYFSSFTAKSWLGDLEDIGQGQRPLCATHPLILVIICA